MDKAKALVRHAISRLNPQDTFQIIRFSEAASSLGAAPLANTPANVERGLRYIDSLHGMGGTHMLAGISAALDYPKDDERLRQVLFLTDGYIGNEDEILASIEQRLGDTRLFSLGLGSSPNRYLLERMGEVGRGTVQYALPNEDAAEVVGLFYERIRTPLLRNIELDWGSFEVAEVTPTLIPDLYAGQPIQVWGRTRDRGPATVTLTGQLGREDIELEVDFEIERGATNPGLRSMWAREQIEDRMGQMLRGPEPTLQEEVVQLSLTHRVMSQWTSFVAIDDEARTSDSGSSVHIPNELADGMAEVFASAPAPTQLFRSHSSPVYQRSVSAAGQLGFSGRGSGAGGYGLSARSSRESLTRSAPRAEMATAGEGRRSSSRTTEAADSIESLPSVQEPGSTDPASVGRIQLLEAGFADPQVGRDITQRLRRWERRLVRSGAQLPAPGSTVEIVVAYDASGAVSLSLGPGAGADARAFLALLERSGLLDLKLRSVRGSVTFQF